MRSEPTSRSPLWEAIAGVLAGAMLAIAVWWRSDGVHRVQAHPVAINLPQPAAAAVPLPPTFTPLPIETCVATPEVVTTYGFDPYGILAQRRQDVLRLYAANGWDPATQCVAIYDNWTGHGPDGGAPTTAAAFVRARGWAPAAPQPTPTPQPGCHAPAAEAARLGFDPYALLAAHRLDVLQFYARNPAPGGGRWDPATQCVAIFDDWLRHPDGGPPQTAAQYALAHHWAAAPAASSSPLLSIGRADGQ